MLALGGTVLFGQVRDYYLSYSSVLQGQTPCVWAAVYLFRVVDESHLAGVLANVKQDGLADPDTVVWLHEQLCVDRNHPRCVFLACALAGGDRVYCPTPSMVG